MLLSARLYNGVPVRSAHLRRDEILFTVAHVVGPLVVQQ